MLFRLQLNTVDQAKALVSYLDSLFKTYAFVDSSLTTDVTAMRGITLFNKYLQKSLTQTNASLLLNLTSIPVYNWTYNTQNWNSCEAFYNGSGGNNTLAHFPMH